MDPRNRVTVTAKSPRSRKGRLPMAASSLAEACYVLMTPSAGAPAPRGSTGSGPPPRRAGELVEALLRAEERAARRRSARGAAVREENTGLDRVAQLDVENLPEPLPQGGSQDREGDLHAVVEIPGHPVRRGEEVLLVATVQEVVDAGVLEEAIDDGDDADPLGQTGQAGAEAADAPDDQVDLHPRLARRAQLV